MRNDHSLPDHRNIPPVSAPDPRDMLGVILITMGFAGLAILFILVEILRTTS
jgi:hypothetical protein